MLVLSFLLMLRDSHSLSSSGHPKPPWESALPAMLLAVALSCGGTVQSSSGGSSGGGAGGAPAADASDASEGCPALAHCNWCQGEVRFDSAGCAVGYTCANGVDPCETAACTGNDSCAANEVCGEDGLCWEKPAVTCVPKQCYGYPTSDGGSGGYPIDAGYCPCEGTSYCNCTWACSDGTTHKSDCGLFGGNCDCGGKQVTCANLGVGGATGDQICGFGASCCGYGEPVL